MKRLLTLFILCLLTVGLLGSISVSAAAGLSVTPSATSVTEGQSVTITLTYDGGGQPIAGIQGTLTYDTKLFTYVSCGNGDVETNVPSGVVKFVYEAPGATAPTSLKIPFTFKAVKPGACTFSAATNEFVDDINFESLGSPTDSVTVSAMAVTATNAPTKSGNANLKRLVPSKGTLTPKFDPKVTDYTVTVPYDVQSVTFSADSEDPDADITISGKSAVAVGENKRVLTVTAPNGTTKKYNLTVIRREAPSTTSGTGSSGTTGTTLPLPPEDALDVTIGGKPMTILDTQAAADLPEGFRWSYLTINYIEVPAAVNEETGMTLLYLVGDDGEGDGFYIYDAAEDTFTPFYTLTVAGGTYLLYDLPADKTLNGMVWGTLDYAGGAVSAYVYHDPSLSDFYVVWAARGGGETGWYTYDKAEGTLQRYYTAAIVDNDGTATTQPPDADVDADGKADNGKKGNTLAAFFADNRQIFLIGGIAVAGIAVIVLLVVMISSLGGHKKGKH